MHKSRRLLPLLRRSRAVHARARTTQAERDEQDLVAFEQGARERGVLLVGQRDAFGPGYLVVALNAADHQELGPRFRATLAHASSHRLYLAALEALLAECLAMLVPDGEQAADATLRN